MGFELGNSSRKDYYLNLDKGQINLGVPGTYIDLTKSVQDSYKLNQINLGISRDSFVKVRQINGVCLEYI